MTSLINKWKICKNEHPFMIYVICFTLVFMFSVTLFYMSFILTKKSFIWQGETKDGLVQHYNALMYFGNYLRSLFHEIFVNHHFSIPMWDFSMGYGADILATMHYYVIGDPLNLLSIFVMPKYTEYLYIFLVVLRLYLAGLSFSYFCFNMNKDKKSIMIGALSYIFCGYIIFAGVRHPYFINPMIYLPLLLLGTEKILKYQSSKLFICMIALSAISNFYFFYMLCLLVFIYAIIRYFSLYQDNHLRHIFYFLGKFIFNVIIGIAISAIILLPVISFFLSTSRSEYKIAFDGLYSISYYLSSFLNFNSYNFGGYWTICAYTSLSLISIFVLFIKRKNIALKVGFIILTIVICLPIGGYIFNGFSYVSNRWQFGYSFIIALITCWMFNDLKKLNKKELIVLAGLCIIYFILAYRFKETRTYNFYLSSFIMFFIYIVMFFYNTKFLKKNSFFVISMVILLVMNTSLNAFFKYFPQQLNYVKEFVEFKDGYSQIYHTRAEQLKAINDQTFYRYDETNTGKTYLVNSALQQNEHSISFFYSLGSGYITDYFGEMNNLNALSSIYTGLNYRAYLDALASVKYFIAEKKQNAYRPYGYNQKVFESDKYDIFKTELSLPLGYTYDKQVSEDDYKNATALQRQQLLLDAVHVEEKLSLENLTPTLMDQNTPYTIVSQSGIRWNENGFDVLDKNAKMIIQFEGVENSELYLSYKNLAYKASKNKKGEYITEAKIKLKSDQVRNTILLKNEYNTYYNGTDDFLVNLGYSENKRKQIEIEFTQKGSYTCKEMSVSHLVMNRFNEQIKNRTENVLENVQMDTNKVSGKISLDKDKFLCLSIPYSEGWQLYVDGQKEKLYRANTMYMGTPLTKGNHDIQLIYTTPFIKIGAMISCSGVILFISVCYYEKKKTKQKINDIKC